MESKHVKCIRCLRMVTKKPSKALRERIRKLTREIQRLRERERCEAE